MEMSQTMKEAVIYAEAHGGKLCRAPGGYWILDTDRSKVPHCHYYGTKTIQALVVRGKAEYTAWQEGRNGKFPIEVTVTKEAVDDK